MVGIFVRAGLVLAAVAAIAPPADFAAARVASEAAGSQSGEHLVALWARDGKVDTRFPKPTGGSFPKLSAIEPDGRGGWFLGEFRFRRRRRVSVFSAHLRIGRRRQRLVSAS